MCVLFTLNLLFQPSRSRIVAQPTRLPPVWNRLRHTSIMWSCSIQSRRSTSRLSMPSSSVYTQAQSQALYLERLARCDGHWFPGSLRLACGSSPERRENFGCVAFMTMPCDLNQPRSLLGGLTYYRKLLRDTSKQIISIAALLKESVELLCTPAIEAILSELLAELASPLVVVSPVRTR